MTEQSTEPRAARPVRAFAEHAARTPDAAAVRYRDRTTCYGELLTRADEHRARLERLPLHPGEAVAVPAVSTPGTLALVLACLLSGRPVLLPPAGLPPAGLRRLRENSGCRYLLTPRTVDGPGGRAAPPAVKPPPGTAVLLTTSGSTGTPKTVPLSGDAMGRFGDWAAARFGIGPGTGVLSHAPLNFDLSLLDVWTTLGRGGRVVLCDSVHAADGRHLAGLLGREEVHLVQAVPMFHRLLLEAAGGARFPGVRHVIVTGEAIPPRDLAALPRLFPAARLHNVYGCTETNDSLLHEIDPADPPDEPVPLGTPLPGVRVLIRTPDGRPLSGPGSGELYVSTPFQSEGYLGATAHDAARFGPHPFGADRRRWYRTGDLVERDERGVLRLRGRDDFQVKVRGTRVDPQTVERVLLDHPEVGEAAVLAVPDPIAGHVLLAVVRPRPGCRPNSLLLRTHCARSLVPASIPGRWRLVDDPLPRTSTGKVDRKLLGRPS
ncbi:AMP-binding protein [Streptomyces sp. ST2-7A]|uniref:AMP-binding protein n=1 Tax=Streptomyces sp. ST2-7A TaxID=2907214 RepID=UPI001F197B3F|nr:AMP-binding protein [Streptomyces sp. ST2-7A]MCE7081102.1 AMP-binding protein [Streptomyces sp. ST2-7A]